MEFGKDLSTHAADKFEAQNSKIGISERHFSLHWALPPMHDFPPRQLCHLMLRKAALQYLLADSDCFSSLVKSVKSEGVVVCEGGVVPGFAHVCFEHLTRVVVLMFAVLLDCAIATPSVLNAHLERSSELH